MLCHFNINSSEYSKFYDPCSLACFSRDLANVFSTFLRVFFALNLQCLLGFHSCQNEQDYTSAVSLKFYFNLGEKVQV